MPSISPLYIFELLQIFALGYLAGDFLEMYLARFQKGRSSVLILILFLVAGVLLGVYAGQFEYAVKTFFESNLYECLGLAAGLSLGLYREKVRKS